MPLAGRYDSPLRSGKWYSKYMESVKDPVPFCPLWSIGHQVQYSWNYAALIGPSSAEIAKGVSKLYGGSDSLTLS